MAYTQNVPQVNQQIGASQPIIEANFQYLQASIGQEHNFDTSDATKTYHLKASMPNQADPGSLPTGTNGMYYVNSNVPKFYSSAGASFFTVSALQNLFFAGTVSALGPGGISNISNIINNRGGYIMVTRSDGTYDVESFYQLTSPSLQNLVSLANNSNNAPFVTWNSGNLAIINSSGSTTYDYHYFGWWLVAV